MKYKFNKIPLSDRPREKLIKYGVHFLTDSELLAIIIRVGNKQLNVLDLSKEIINNLKKLNDFKNISIEELKKIKGIGNAKACEVIASIEFGYRIYTNSHKSLKIKEPIDVFNYIRKHLYNKKQEHFIAIYLDSHNKIICHKTLFIGTIDNTIIHPREIFKEAFKNDAIKIILCHNHPSNNLYPSKSDIETTKYIVSISEMMDVKIVDHIIIGDKDFFSLKENNLF